MKINTNILTDPVARLAEKIEKRDELSQAELALIADQSRRQAKTLARAMTFLSQSIEIEKSRHSVTVYTRQGKLKEIKF